MNLFKLVKESITVKQAAALYGLARYVHLDDSLPSPRGPYPQHEAE